ncbi:MAG: RIP metalloprotease RseP [Lachnospiraceae bacterium]|nr:RIP metalloprotease RseP [Lachnospiraceae bacterium]
MAGRILSFVIAFLVFGILILFHELGHFLLAKANGVKVNEFCFGLGPTLFGIQKGETKYSVKLFPFGGACMMEGEDEESPDERAFGSKSVWARMSIVFAGPFFNFIMAFVFAFILMSCIGYDKPVLTGVTDGFPAQEAGIMEGDEIVKINHMSIHFAREIQYYTTFHSGETLDITYLRDGDKYEVTLTPELDEESGRYLYGISYSVNVREKGSILTNLKNSFYELRYWIYTTIQSVRMLVTGQVSPNELMGPVGIVKNVGEVFQESAKLDGYYWAFLNVLNWAILLAANLGVMNLLPIPALDGGRLVFLIVEAVRGKRIDPKKEGMVNLVGLLILFALMIVVMFNDIRKIFMG